MRKTLLALVLPGLALPALAQAQDAAPDEAAVAVAEEAAPADVTWSGSGELSYLLKRGNSRSDHLAAKLNAERDSISWRHIAKLEVSNVTQRTDDGDDERTAERYFGSYKLDRKLDDANYIFNLVTGEKDRFTGYDYQATYALGYGRRMIENERHVLDLEVGPGFRTSKYDRDHIPASGRTRENEGIFYAGAKYRWQISETAQFSEDLTTETGRTGSVIRATTSLTTQISGALGLRLSHVLRHVTEPADGDSKSDQEVTIGVVYDF